MYETRQDLIDLLVSGGSVAVLTGAGISAESGIPTFRGADGMWEHAPVEEVATPRGFFNDPLKAWKFYDERRTRARDVLPNPAHLALARLEDIVPKMTVITQNIDDLHRQAGSSTIIELHGNIWRLRCTDPKCGRIWEDRTAPFPTLPPVCPKCGEMARPDVVWFEEPLPAGAMSFAHQACRCRVFMVIGTSAMVYPAAALPLEALALEAMVVEVNIAPTPLTSRVHLSLRGKAGEILPTLVEEAVQVKRQITGV